MNKYLVISLLLVMLDGIKGYTCPLPEWRLGNTVNCNTMINRKAQRILDEFISKQGKGVDTRFLGSNPDKAMEAFIKEDELSELFYRENNCKLNLSSPYDRYKWVK